MIITDNELKDLLRVCPFATTQNSNVLWRASKMDDINYHSGTFKAKVVRGRGRGNKTMHYEFKNSTLQTNNTYRK